MRRGPRVRSLVGHQLAPSPIQQVSWQDWVDAREAAIVLRKFTRNGGEPSLGAIRNMVYRGQLRASKPFGRLLFSRRDLEQLLVTHLKQGA